MTSFARTWLGLSCALLLIGGAARADSPDPSNIPGVGSVAPAFGLYPLPKGTKAEKEPGGRVAIQLDELCGLRPNDTKLVLVVFVDASGKLLEGDPLTAWHRKFHKEGLEILAISIEHNPAELAARVKRARFNFPVLDDRHGVVAHRYGVDRAPFTFLLDSECRVLGIDNKEPVDSAAALTVTLERVLLGIEPEPAEAGAD